MKNTLLTLSLLVGFAPAVIANGTGEVKPVVNTEVPAEQVVAPWYQRAYNVASAHVSNNKKAYTIGALSTVAVSGLGYAGYKNPRTVRSVVKSTKRFGRRGLNFVNAHKLATLGSVAGSLTLYLAICKREAVKEACKNGWTKFLTGCQNKWANRPSWMGNKVEETK